jgi:hypothetical protein
MPSSSYPYQLNQFANGVVALDRLDQEIRTSSVVTALDWLELAGSTCTIWFKAALSGPDQATLNALVAQHQGVPLAQPPQTVVLGETAAVTISETAPVELQAAALVTLTSPRNPTDHTPHIAIKGREGAEVIYASHNLCDPTTWYSESIRVEAEPLVDSGDGLTWTSANTNWIDMTSGKVMDDDGVRADSPHGWLITVLVDDVEATMREPLEDSGGDYEVDYGAGTITFFTPQTGAVVTCTYSYATGSAWVLKPAEGRALDIESAEAQFSDDAIMLDTVKFSVWGWAGVFAPAAVAAELLGPTDLVELGSDRYKRIHQIVDNAMGAFPVIPAVGGATRGTQHAIYGFPFRYGTIRRLYAQYGMELRVELEHDRAFGGERCTATFYAVSQLESALQ